MSNLSGSGTLRGSLSRGGGTPSDVYWDDILNKPDFATVATSGSYNDLLDKPTIPPAPTVMTGATAQSNGVAGYVSQPLAGDQNKFLNGAGEWVTPPSSSVNYSTEEQIIGAWIDGKPIYQKTIVLSSETTVSNNDWTSTGITASSLDIETYISCTAQNNSGTCWNAMSVATVNSNISLTAWRNGDTIGVKIFTIQYTKTNDTIGG